jgi:SAM-dependent methyltransferase
MSYLQVQGQQGMTLDERRNQAYLEALEKVITPESVVLDLGAGLGIHGLMAAKLGAKRVYLVEPEDIITVAGEIAQANGFGDRVQCLQGKIEDVELPEPVDVIISVFTGNFLLEEDLLPSLFYARDKYLKPDGVMIPSAGIMEAAPAHNPELHTKEIEVWSKAHHGIIHTPARAYASQSIYYYNKGINQSAYLAEPQSLMALDFYTATSTHCQSEVNYTLKESSLCHGWAGWFKMKLGDTWLSTAPHEPSLHWSAAFLPLDPPLSVTQGESITLRLQRPVGGDWTWNTQTSQAKQQRSTFFAVPMTLKTLRCVASDYKPQLSDKGEALLYILSNCNGTLSVQEIVDRLLEKYPMSFKARQEAFQFVRGISTAYGDGDPKPLVEIDITRSLVS